MTAKFYLEAFFHAQSQLGAIFFLFATGQAKGCSIFLNFLDLMSGVNDGAAFEHKKKTPPALQNKVGSGSAGECDS